MLLALEWPWTTYLTSLCFCFLLCTKIMSIRIIVRTKAIKIWICSKQCLAHILLLLYIPFVILTSCLLHQTTLNFAGQDPHLFCLPAYPQNPAQAYIWCLINSCWINVWWCGRLKVQIYLLVLNCRIVRGEIMTDGVSDRYAWIEKLKHMESFLIEPS